MKKKKPIQYTVRNVPERVDDRLREASVQYGTSINTVALDALSRGLGMEADTAVHHDLDDLIGTWVRDKACEKVLEEMDQVDAELWT